MTHAARVGLRTATVPDGPDEVVEASSQRSELEPGSFRDRRARVFYRDGAVLRGLTEEARRDWRFVQDSGLLARCVAAGWIVATDEVAVQDDPWAAILRHEPIPFISYPYEWSFDMLRDAALLHLDLLAAALDAGCIIQDASPFNVQWKGTTPVFIDVASLRPLQRGETWVAYRQFCELFLYPLLLQSYRGVSLRPWLRGRLDGIRPDECWQLMSLRDLFRRGVFAHVYLHARAQARHADSARNVRGELQQAGFGVELIRHNVRHMRKLVSGLHAPTSESPWLAYASQNSYSTADEAAKTDFVRSVAAQRMWRSAWDLGCNTGNYTRLIAPHARTVVAIDCDEAAVARLYRSLPAEGIGNVLPLIADLTDPPPDLGWRGRERKSFVERGKPDLILCLALLHHVVISGNVPLPEFVSWLGELGAELVIEFATRDDAMVQRLLRNRDDQYSDYDLATFEQCVRRHFSVVRSQPVCEGRRVLYHLAPRSGVRLAR